MMCEGINKVGGMGDIRFPPALSLLTRVWVGVTEVPQGVAGRSSQPVRGYRGVRSHKFELVALCLFFLCELFCGLTGFMSGPFTSGDKQMTALGGL